MKKIVYGYTDESGKIYERHTNLGKRATEEFRMNARAFIRQIRKRIGKSNHLDYVAIVDRSFERAIHWNKIRIKGKVFDEC